MVSGISGLPVPAAFPFSAIINSVSIQLDFFPCLVGAIKMNETGLGTDPTCLQDGGDPTTGLLPDGSTAGRGLMQLTSSFPSDWADPTANITYAITQFLRPAYVTFSGQGLTGGDLVKCIAAGYNEGLGAAEYNHGEGNVDAGTTNDYGERALEHYTNLIQGVITS